MTVRKPDTLSCPPFPEFTWDEYFWTCSDTLPAWFGFPSRGGSYCAEDSNSPSDGTVDLVVATDEDDRSPPTPAQIAAYGFLKSNDHVIVDAILNRIFEEYPAIREQYADFLGDSLADDMPEIQRPDDLKTLIGLGNVHFHRTSKDRVAYLGFELGCTWDIEHGLGVMLHKDRIVEFGGADTAILEWIADRDATT